MRILRKTSEALSVSEELTKPYVELCNVGDGDISERIRSDASAPVRSVHSRMLKLRIAGIDHKEQFKNTQKGAKVWQKL